MLQLVVLSVAAFASANLDDIFLLTAWLGDPKLRPSQVYAGQFIGFGVLALASAVCATLFIRVSGHYLAFLGILPILLGVRRLWMSWKGVPEEPSPDHHALKIMTVATVTIVNGTDDLAVFVPLLAKAGILALPLVMTVFFVMTGLWCIIATAMARHQLVAGFLDRWGHKLMPVLLIALGIYILNGAL